MKTTIQKQTGFFKPALLTLVLAASCQAQLITIMNNSFETDAAADGNTTSAVSFWTKGGSGTIVTRDPNNTDYAGTTGEAAIAGMSGPQILSIAPNLLSTASVSQSTGISITAGTTYVLTVSVGNSLTTTELLAAGSISILAGGNVVSTATSGNVADGSFDTLSTTFTAGAGSAFLGQTLGVRLSGTSLAGGVTSSRVDFDNVTLTAVPEPSSLALIGLAGPAVWVWKSRRRRL